MLLIRKFYYYNNEPDGKAPLEKVMAMTEAGVKAGLLGALYDAVWITDTKNAKDTINCFAFWLVPIVGMSVTWASVTYMSTNIRGKDDWVNYVIGSAACSPILHAWMKGLGHTVVATATLMVTAGIIKVKQQNNWDFFPDKVQHSNGINQFDMTLTKQYDKDFRSGYKFFT